MFGRHLFVVTLGALGALTAACHLPEPGEEAIFKAGQPDAAPDAAGPETTITGGPTGPVTAGTQIVYTFTSVPGALFACRVDGAPYERCTSPYAITALSGQHTFEVYARAPEVGLVDSTPATHSYNGIGGTPIRVRLMAGNITSGNAQAYEGPGTRIFQGLHPDIVMIQEFNVGNNSAATIRAWVDTTFGTSFAMFRESGAQIPNGIISRYPILQAGIWEDAQSPNREFAYARIDVPGPKDLWAISLHLLTDGSRRPAEATALVNYINANIPAGDYLVLGGDLNTDSRTETAVNTLGQVVNVGSPFPVDQANDGDTNAGRSKPYDWVMLDSDLNAIKTAVVIGSASFPNGLVFDSRVFTPLSAVSPVLASDSAATNMQHMGVVKDILIPAP